MKIQIVFLFVLLQTCFVTAQSKHICNVSHQQEIMERLLTNRKANQEGLLSKQKDQNHIPIQYHIVRSSNQNESFDFMSLMEELCFINQIFAKSGMSLFIKNDINFIVDDSLFNYRGDFLEPGEYANEKLTSILQEGEGNALNLVYYDSAVMDGVSAFPAPLVDCIIFRKAINSTQWPTLLAHEVGHYFGLLHPHNGWEHENIYDKNIHGDTVIIETVGPMEVPVELVNGENCEMSGDLICDTPPDYNFGGSWPNDCSEYDNEVWDRNGDLIMPDQFNIMGSFIGCDDMSFSPGQLEAMQLDIASDARSYLRTDYVPVTQQINEKPEFIAPAFNETVDYFDSVNLQWTALEYATDYYIKILGGGDEFIYFAKDSILHLQELKPSTSYRVSIYPFNESGGCAFSQNTVFRTSELSTSTLDQDLDRELTIHPNPIKRGEKIRINYNGFHKGPIECSLISLEGKIVYQEQLTFRDNEIEIGLVGLETGLYFIRIESNKGYRIEKLFVE